jgi:hypothetical protein
MMDRSAIESTSDEVRRKLYCRIEKAPPGATEVEVSLLKDVTALLLDYSFELAQADRHADDLWSQLLKEKRAVLYRDRVISKYRAG